MRVWPDVAGLSHGPKFLDHSLGVGYVGSQVLAARVLAQSAHGACQAAGLWSVQRIFWSVGRDGSSKETLE